MTLKTGERFSGDVKIKLMQLNTALDDTSNRMELFIEK
jgi:small nuclear ribonucleoprotein (snRNP)-like protein